MNRVKKEITDKDLAMAEVALRRAAKRTRMIAIEAHTPLVSLCYFYFGIKYEFVWQTIEDVIPAVKPAIQKC